MDIAQDGLPPCKRQEFTDSDICPYSDKEKQTRSDRMCAERIISRNVSRQTALFHRRIRISVRNRCFRLKYYDYSRNLPSAFHVSCDFKISYIKLLNNKFQ